MTLMEKLHMYEVGTPQNHCVFILTCLNFSHIQSTLHLMQYTC